MSNASIAEEVNDIIIVLKDAQCDPQACVELVYMMLSDLRDRLNK